MWLNLVRTSLHQTSLRHRGFQPDFLIPQVGGDVDSPIFSSPMSRAQGVILLRRFLLQWNSSADVQFIGVQSTRARSHFCPGVANWPSTRSFAGIKDITELLAQANVSTCIAVMMSILSKIGSGFRPVIPLLRGGAPAIPDKPVVVPPVPQFTDLPIETSISPPALQDHIDTDSNASSEAGLDKDEPTPAPLVIRRCEGVADCLFHSFPAECALHGGPFCQ